MPKKKRGPKGPERVAVLEDQPGDASQVNALQQLSRRGTYEVQSTAETEGFFPAIAQGRYGSGTLAQLQRQAENGAQ